MSPIGSVGGKNRNVPPHPPPPPPPRVEESKAEQYPSDPASTTPQLLSALWELIAKGVKELTKGESMTLLFPNMEDQFTASYLNRLTGHFDICKDVCDDFGVNTVLVPYTVPTGPSNAQGRQSASKCIGFVVKSYRNPNTLTDDGEYNFEPDPFWDDDEDWDSLDAEIAKLAALEGDDGVGGEVGAGGGVASAAESTSDDDSDPSALPNRIPDDDDEITETSRAWVAKMMADLGICPFTADADKSGMPMGPVYYAVDRSTRMEDVYSAYWKMVVKVEQSDERDLSTTLHIFPNFCMDNIESFENFSNTLTQPLESLGVEELLQLVFFHPEWTFRDGGARSGMGSAANYARRSPWPMINILRTNQVRAAQRGIPTGLVYQQNEKTLRKVGTTQLESMLRKRDWSDIEELKVNRRDMEALRIAQDYKETGTVAAEDRDFVHDSTPAANKVDKSQIEGGDMLKVVLQALEKRLEGGPDGGVQGLSGPETSAAMMASDFVLEHLKEMSG